MTVYKYPFEISDSIVVRMPANAKVLKVECQGSQPCIWALVDPSEKIAEHRFCIYGTGHTIDEPIGPHIATFQMLGGELVWHLFKDIS